MPDYSVEKFIIRNGRVLGYDEFYDFDRVKIAFIESDFDMDDDCSNHFLCMKDLERFEVLDERSRFYTEEGVLFVNVREKGNDRIRDKELFYDFPDILTGKVLVAFPTNYPQKKYSVPNGTVAICKGAFEGTVIEELTLPDSIQFIDFHALENTCHLSTLRVPDKMIEIWDHWEIGTKDNFMIICNDGVSCLSEEVITMWNRLTAPFCIEELADDVLGKAFRGEHETFHRYITWPDEETEKTMMAIIGKKESVFQYYQNNKNRKDQRTQNLLALVYYLVKPCILHPTTDVEAETLVEMLFGEKGIETDWLKKYAGSPRDYKQINGLLQSDIVSFFNYISNSQVRKLFQEKAVQILKSLSEKDDIIALPNLLSILHDNDVLFRNDAIIQKAVKIHEPVAMWDTARTLYKWGGERTKKAMMLFHDLAYSEDILPHPHIDRIRRMALNNYMWLNSLDDIDNAVKSLGIHNDPPFELPF